MARKALVVEDDVVLSELLAEVLKRMQFEPSILNEGKHAVEFVRKNRPDLILLDLMLPDISGYDICQAMKLDRETNLIPIVIVTARTQSEDKLRGLQVGANYYL